MREQTFSPKRAIESVLFLANRLPNPTIHGILKLRYFADKLHMASYGFMASGDDYYALKFGPVGSHTYNLLKAARGERNGFIHPALVEAALGNIVVEEKNVRPLRDANLDVLAPSDLECLERAVAIYGQMSFRKMTEISHDAAWLKTWNSDDTEMMVPTDIAGTLDNANEVLEYMSL